MWKIGSARRVTRCGNCAFNCELLNIQVNKARGVLKVKVKMSEPPKVTIKNKLSNKTENDDEDHSRPQSVHQTPVRKTTLNRQSSSRNAESENGSANSFRRQSRKTRRSDANIESITLQESAKKSQPVTLKASFLRRKIKEYEGKKNRR